jgi:hypothetical protein
LTTFVDPVPLGSFAPRPQGHAHAMRIISYTLEGPLKVLTGCAWCSKTEVVKPNPLLRNIPAGFTRASWGQFLKRGAERDAQQRLEAQART